MLKTVPDPNYWSHLLNGSRNELFKKIFTTTIIHLGGDVDWQRAKIQKGNFEIYDLDSHHTEVYESSVLHITSKRAANNSATRVVGASFLSTRYAEIEISVDTCLY